MAAVFEAIAKNVKLELLFLTALNIHKRTRRAQNLVKIVKKFNYLIDRQGK